MLISRHGKLCWSGSAARRMRGLSELMDSAVSCASIHADRNRRYWRRRRVMGVSTWLPWQQQVPATSICSAAAAAAALCLSQSRRHELCPSV